MAVTERSAAAFELKGRMTTLTVLRVLTPDPATLLLQLDARLAQAPDFFDGMPLVVVPADGITIEPDALTRLVAGLRDRQLLPVAAAGMKAEEAAAAGLGVISNLDEPRAEAAEATTSERRERPTPVDTGAARLVTQPVRSGQQVYARGGDLIVTAPVSAGAELMADGHIHVYDTLRGRALAGVQGDENARIFCRSLQAELVAVAGHYRLSDQINADLRDAPAMVWLRDGELELNAL